MASRREQDEHNKLRKKVNETLKNHRCQLMKEIDVNNSELIDFLFQEGVIEERFNERIALQHYTNSEKVGMLLDHICKRPWTDYNKFRDGLKHCGMIHILNILPEATGQSYWTDDIDEVKEYVDSNINLDKQPDRQIQKMREKTNSIEIHNGACSKKVTNKLRDSTSILPGRILRVVMRLCEIPKEARVFSRLIETFSNLKCLCLYDLGIEQDSIANIGVELAACLMHLPDLHRLDIRGIDLKNYMSGVLLSISCATKLKLLNLCGIPLNGFHLELIQVLEHLPELRWLDLSGAGLHPDETDIVLRTLAKNCEHITGLLMTENFIGEGYTETVAPELGKLKKLKMVFLSVCDMHDENDLLDIVSDLPPSVEVLDVAGNLLAENKIDSFLGELKKIQSLSYLSVTIDHLKRRGREKITRFCEDEDINLVIESFADELWEELIQKVSDCSAEECPY